MHYVLLENDISKLPLSVRLVNVLKRNGVKNIAEMIQCKENGTLKDFVFIGEKGAAEVEQWVESLETGANGYCIASNEDEIAQCRANDALEELKRPISASELPFSIQVINALLRAGIKTIGDLHNVTEKMLLSIKRFSHNDVRKILTYINKDMQSEEHNVIVPSKSNNTKTAHNNNEKEDVCNSPSIVDYLNAIGNDKRRQIVLDRLNGKILEKIGEHYGITRERVRQICFEQLRILRKKVRHFREEKYLCIFSKYDISKSDFTLAFNEPACIYYYLKYMVKDTAPSLKPIEAILQDNDIPFEIRKQIEKVIYKDYVIINGEKIYKSRMSLLNYYTKVYCRTLTKYDDFEKGYKSFISTLELSDDDKEILDAKTRRLEDRLCQYMFILRNQRNQFRYYDIQSRDYDDFLKKINLLQYGGLKISALKIFNENPELMKEYDIHDEYELHNLLRKIWDKSDNRVVFKRMPMIKIKAVASDKDVLPQN